MGHLRSSETVKTLLARFPAPIRELTLEARRWLETMVPTASERVYPGWRGLGYRDEQAGYFCGLFPREDHVRLLFEHGAALPDPHHLLEGSTRQTRYVTLRHAADLQRRGLQQLVHAALIHGANRRTPS